MGLREGVSVLVKPTNAAHDAAFDTPRRMTHMRGLSAMFAGHCRGTFRRGTRRSYPDVSDRVASTRCNASTSSPILNGFGRKASAP